MNGSIMDLLMPLYNLLFLNNFMPPLTLNYKLKLMKLLICSLSLLFQFKMLLAQNIGIGTITPHTSAQLEIKSTTGGLLIPAMNSPQMINITNPAEGLLVYNSTLLKLYQYQDGAWRNFIDNSYWSQSTTRQRTYNLTDSIGIGTSNLTERLHVSGNIMATGDLLNAGGGITMNNTTGTLQLQAVAVNKGFVQLSGNNLRMGTNSGNSTGNMIIRMTGTDRVFVNQVGQVGIGVASPATTLDVLGNINLNGNITKRNSTLGYSLTPLCYGKVAADGTIISGSGNFTITSWGQINCPGMTWDSFVFVNSVNDVDVNVTFYPGGQFAGAQFTAFKFAPVWTTVSNIAYQFVVFK